MEFLSDMSSLISIPEWAPCVGALQYRISNGSGFLGPSIKASLEVSLIDRSLVLFVLYSGLLMKMFVENV